MSVSPYEIPGEFPEYPSGGGGDGLPWTRSGGNGGGGGGSEFPQLPVPTVPVPNTPTGGGGLPAANPPSWAHGVFYGSGPGGERIILTITAGGSISANINGTNFSGHFVAADRFTIGGAQGRIEQTAVGLDTVRVDNGQRISYSRTNPAGGVLPSPPPSFPTTGGTSTPTGNPASPTAGNSTGESSDEDSITPETLMLVGGVLLLVILIK